MAKPSLKPSKNPNELPPAAVEELITTAERHYREGEAQVLAGSLDKARVSFNLAVITIQSAGPQIESNPRLREYFNTLLERVRGCEQSHRTTLMDPVDPVAQELAGVLAQDPAGDPASRAEAERRAGPGDPSLVDEADDPNLFPLVIDSELSHLVSEDLAQTRFGIPMMFNERVVRFINFFRNDPRRRERFAEGLARSGEYLPMMKERFQEAGIPTEVVYMAMVESLFNPYAYSRARARGIWQFIAPTGRLYKLRQDSYIDERCDPERSTQAAVKHILNLYREFGDWILVMAAYNAGSGTIQRAIARGRTRDFWELAERRYLPRETADHVPAIMASIIIANNPERYGFSSALRPAQELDRVALGHPISLSVVSKYTGLSVPELKALNPALARSCTPLNYPDYELKLPLGMGEKLSSSLDDIPVSAWLLRSDMARTVRVASKKGRRGNKAAVTKAVFKTRSGKSYRGKASRSVPVSTKKSRSKRTTSKVRKV